MVVIASGERNAVGETINLAARLQTIAKPGSIIVSESVRRMAGGGFEYEDLGEKELKGVSGPTRVYRVLGVSRAESRFEAATQRDLTPIVGREAEISALLDDWRQVQETGVGKAILLRGESGIGKSRMASALRERAPGRRARLWCFNARRSSSTAPFIRSEPPSNGRCSRAKTAARKPGWTSSKRWPSTGLGLARDDMRLVAALLSIPHEQRYGSILLSPKLAKEETMRVLIEFVRAHARMGPTLLLFEDAHWADPTTLDLLDALRRNATRHSCAACHHRAARA